MKKTTESWTQASQLLIMENIKVNNVAEHKNDTKWNINVIYNDVVDFWVVFLGRINFFQTYKPIEMNLYEIL